MAKNQVCQKCGEKYHYGDCCGHDTHTPPMVEGYCSWECWAADGGPSSWDDYWSGEREDNVTELEPDDIWKALQTLKDAPDAYALYDWGGRVFVKYLNEEEIMEEKKTVKVRRFGEHEMVVGVIGADQRIMKIVVPAEDYSLVMENMELSWTEPKAEPEPHLCQGMGIDVRYEYAGGQWWLSEHRSAVWWPVQQFHKCPCCGWTPPTNEEDSRKWRTLFKDVEPGSVVESSAKNRYVKIRGGDVVSLDGGILLKGKDSFLSCSLVKIIEPPQ